MEKEHIISHLEDRVNEATGTSRRLHKEIKEELQVMAVAASRGNKQHIVEDKRDVILGLLARIESSHIHTEQDAHELVMEEILNDR